jgi:sporulation protein YlmC with PRC-barrel domain
MANANGERAEILRSRDFIGWAVTSANGANVGTVSDILIDRRGQVRFLAIDPGFFKKPFLLPVDALEWGEGSLQCAWTDAEMKRLPPYDAGVPLTESVLAELRHAFPRYYGGQRPEAFADAGEGATVVPLRDAKGFRLEKGAPDLKGWSVYSSVDNEKVGTVAQMLVDPVAMRIRYLDVDVEDDLFGLTDDRHVLVPLENVDLRERSSDAWVDGLAGRDIARLPAYLGGPVDPHLERATDEAFGASAQRPALVDHTSDAPALPPPATDALPPPAPVPSPIPDAPFAADAPPPPPAGDAGAPPPIVVHDAPPPRES